MPWPSWLETMTNLSHFLTTLNSSVTFFIYFAKHYQTILHCGHLEDSSFVAANRRLEFNSTLNLNVDRRQSTLNLNVERETIQRSPEPFLTVSTSVNTYLKNGDNGKNTVV
jgi:hypothetical protein